MRDHRDRTSWTELDSTAHDWAISQLLEATRWDCAPLSSTVLAEPERLVSIEVGMPTGTPIPTDWDAPAPHLRSSFAATARRIAQWLASGEHRLLLVEERLARPDDAAPQAPWSVERMTEGTCLVDVARSTTPTSHLEALLEATYPYPGVAVLTSQPPGPHAMPLLPTLGACASAVLVWACDGDAVLWMNRVSQAPAPGPSR